MIDERERFERAFHRFQMPDPAWDRLVRRRDRKRRNRRISAGMVGIAVFVAGLWIVKDLASLDATRTPLVPGGAETGPVRTGPAVTEPTRAVGPVPETDYLLDLDSGEMTPLPKKIHGSEYVASPDGSSLAYADRGDNGRSQIFVANIDGTGIEQVTHDLDAAFSPAWSPDGSKIAFIGVHYGRALRDLFVLDLATGASTQLSFSTLEPDPAKPDWSPWEAFLPSFTPDGRSIVYGTSRGDARAIHFESETRSVPVAGGESVRLMEGVEEVRLSPDGTLLSYDCGGSICVANSDGTNERVLVLFEGDGLSGRRAWSPDSTRIAYYAFHSQDVFITDVATGQTTYVAEGDSPTWLDDHTLIVEMSSCYNPSAGNRETPGCKG